MASVHKALGIIVVSAMIAGVVCAQEAEWNQWGGSNRDFLAKDEHLLQQWPDEGPELVWKGTGLGGGYSTVSFWGDKIFTLGDKADGCYLVCVSKADGKPVWSKRVGKAGGNDARRPGPRSCPATDGTRVIALGQYGELVCFDVASGDEIWRKHYESDFGATDMPRWNYCDSPLLDGERVVCLPGGPKGAMVALNKRTGDLLWQSKEVTDNISYSSMIPADVHGMRQYIAATDARIFAIHPENGRLVWQAAREVRNVIPSPIYRDGIVFISSGYNAGCHGFKITREGDQFKAEQIYDDKSVCNQHGGSILVGDHVYTSIDRGGRLTCLEFKTGKIVWQNESVGKASLGYADGHLIVRSENGPVALVEASPEGYKEKGRFNQPDRSEYNSWAYPIIEGGRLYLRDQDVLLCYQIAE